MKTPNWSTLIIHQTRFKRWAEGVAGIRECMILCIGVPDIEQSLHRDMCTLVT